MLLAADVSIVLQGGLVQFQMAIPSGQGALLPQGIHRRRGHRSKPASNGQVLAEDLQRVDPADGEHGGRRQNPGAAGERS